MRKFVVLSLALLLAAPAFAQTPGNMEFGLWATYWDVKDGDDNVWGPGMGFGFPVMENLKVDLRLSYFPDIGEDNYGDLEIMPLDLGLSWHYVPCETWDLSVMGGATYAFINSDPNIDGVGDIDDSWGAYIGMGATYKFNPSWGLFTNVYYRFLEADIDVRTNLIDFDKYDASGLNVDVGLKYYF